MKNAVNCMLLTLRALLHSGEESDRQTAATLGWLYEHDEVEDTVIEYITAHLGEEWRTEYELTCQMVADLALDLLIFRTYDNRPTFVMFKDDDSVPVCLREALTPITEAEDFRYQVMRDACEALSDLDDHEWDSNTPHLEADIYDVDLCRWLNGKAHYVNEAIEDFGAEPDIMHMIMRGQALEKREVMDQTVYAIQQLVTNAKSLWP